MVVLLLTLVPFLSIFNSWSVYSQSPYRSFTVLLGQFMWVIYFLLHKYKVSEQTILKAFLCIALIIVAIQIVQQFTYPNAPFGTMSEDAVIDRQVLRLRNNVMDYGVSECIRMAFILLPYCLPCGCGYAIR